MIFDITIGSSLEALQHAYQNDTKLILNQLCFPDKFEPSYVKRAWGLLYTKLMLDGKIIGGDTVKNVQITDNYILVVCEYNVINKFKYKMLHIFSDIGVIGLPEVTQQNDKYKVIDVLKSVSLVTANEKKIIKTNDTLVRRLYVIKKYDRAPIEIYSVSFLTKEQLINFDYSDTMVKFKSEHLLKENNFKGSMLSSSTRADINLEVIKRIVNKKMDKYEETEKIKFIYEN